VIGNQVPSDAARRRARAALALAAALVGLAAAPAAAQEVAVRARVDRTQIAEGDELILTVDISGPSIEQAGPPDISRIEDFEVAGGPSRSHRFQWINGRTSTTISFAYVLRSRGPGRRLIPPLGLLVQGRTYRTEAIAIEVVPGPAGGAGPPGVPPAVGPGRGFPPRPQPGTRAPAAPAVLLRADVEPRTVYVGQQVTLRVHLDTQPEVLNIGLKDTPTFPGFWAEDIKLPENLEMKRVQIGNEPYNEYTLLKKALFPTGSGTLTIPSLTYQVQIRRRGADPIESFFFTPTDTLTRRTEPIAVRVEPLPAAGRPAEFSGAVGQFQLSVTADRQEARVNDAVGLKIRVTGEGNLNAVNTLPLGTLTDFKQYAPRVTSSSSFHGDRLRSERVWDYVLIPLAPGAQAIPPVRFSYFDPRAGSYRSVGSAPITIQVARGPEGAAGGVLPSLVQRDVRALRRDIHYIKPATGGLRDRSRPLHRSPLFAALLVLPVAADVGILAWARRRHRWQATARVRRERRARRLARRRFKEARRRLTPSTSRAFYAEVARALAEYVADKFDVAAAGLTHDRIEDLLASRGVPDDLRAAFHRCLEACDYARFAPAASGPAEMQQTLERAEGTLVALERALSA
jgi:hypothetical protein